MQHQDVRSSRKYIFNHHVDDNHPDNGITITILRKDPTSSLFQYMLRGELCYCFAEELTAVEPVRKKPREWK